jgi:hypothetical protein
MPQAQQTDVHTESSPASPADAHLAQLHKMSTTAGVTNQGYVAVNQTAVVAVFLGLASALALLGWLLLVIPVVGIIFAVVAIWQIKDSAGTQTGRGLAIAGLALCLLLGGGEVVKEWREIAAKQDDENKIAATLSDVGKFIRAGQFDGAYALFDDAFRKRVSLKQFKSTWDAVQAPAALDQMQSMEWNGVSPHVESAGGIPLAETKAIIKFKKVSAERFDVTMRKVGDKWLISRMAFFPEPKKSNNSQDSVFEW